MLFDDAYRPIPAGDIFLLPLGIQTVSTADGEFAFVDLEPGAYQLLAQSPDHEGTKIDVTVKEGEFTEQHIEARRIVSQSGRIIVQEYSVFIPCTADFLIDGMVSDCGIDQSGDSWRPGFTIEPTETNVTFMVTEAQTHQQGEYSLQVRHDDNSTWGGERYAVGALEDGYIRMINEFGVANEEHNKQQNNVPWMNDKPYATVLFSSGEMSEEFAALDDDIADGWIVTGVGVGFAHRATVFQSLFIGPPEVDVETYCVICPA